MWIKVSERYPEVGKYVQTKNSESDEDEIYLAYVNKKWWDGSKSMYAKNPPTHWFEKI